MLVLAKVTTLLKKKKIRKQGISKAVINDWCSLIMRQTYKFDFVVKEYLLFKCSSSFHVADIHKAARYKTLPKNGKSPKITFME